MGDKKPHLPDTFEPKDDEPPAKRPKFTHDKDGEAEPSDHNSDARDSFPSGSQYTPQKSDPDKDEEVPGNDGAEESSASQENAEAGKHRLELFGQDQDWKGITAATKRIGLSNNKALSHKDQQIPSPESQPIKELLKVIEGARQLYRSVTKTPEIFDAVTKLHQSVAELSEASCQGTEIQVITDIYFHAVPKLVGLLKAVLKGRRRQLKEEDNLAVLEEVIGVQDCLFILCTKARGWRSKLTTVLPAKQPVQHIRLRIGAMRSGFIKEYDRRKVLLKRISNQARSRAREEARIQQEKHECEEKQRKLEERRRQVREDVLRSQLMSSPQRHRACKDGSMVCKASQSAP
ncbi:MAG: hypothetical protein LQ350_003917 [Teloschistes chrysophthalmus]|nr:MAG: hypothetical protein LQ350_003917 [Niorma chrysophthalma]